MDKSEVLKLFGLFAVMTVVLLASLPGGSAQADGAGGFPTPTPTASIIIVPTFTPTIIIIPTNTSIYPYPIPGNNTLNLTIPESQPESQGEALPESEGGRGLSSIVCLAVVVVAGIVGLFVLNLIRKNYQGGT